MPINSALAGFGSRRHRCFASDNSLKIRQARFSGYAFLHLNLQGIVQQGEEHILRQQGDQIHVITLVQGWMVAIPDGSANRALVDQFIREGQQRLLTGLEVAEHTIMQRLEFRLRDGKFAPHRHMVLPHIVAVVQAGHA